MKASIIVLAMTALLTGIVVAQSSTAIDDTTLPRFEVVSVKPGDNSSLNASANMEPGQYRVGNVPLVNVVSMGFDIPGSRIEGPGWIFSDRFTIAARISPGASNTQRPLMVRALLLDRFKLRYHITKKDGSGYELRLVRADGQLGPQLHRSTSNCATRRSDNQAFDAECRYNARPGNLEGDGIPAGVLAAYLGAQLDAVIVDRTGLTGDVDVSLQYARESLRAGIDPQAGQNGASVFAALKEQLGLTLERVRVTIDYLVVDAISQPEPD